MRLAVLGHGFAGDLHTRAIAATGLTVAVVAGRDAARTAAFAARHRVERWTLDWREAVCAPDVDAVVIATPNGLHHAECLAAGAAGKHVLVDKPMAVRVAEGVEMREAARAAGRTLLVGHMWRYRDEVVALRDRIEAGAVGTPVRTRGHGIHAGWGPGGWFVDPALAGGGALIDMGIHAIDTARFVLGDPSPVRVQASLGTARGGYAVDDDGVVLVDWDNGVRSVIECGWWQPRLDGVEAETEVHGTVGYTRIWPQFTATSPPPPDYEHCSLPMFAAQMADFAHCCASGDTPRASADGGLVALAVVEAAYESNARPAQIPLAT